MKKLILVLATLLSLSGISATTANAVSVSIAIGDQPYYIHGPGYYVGPVYYLWVPGHWRWHHGHRYWVHGYYVRR
jgi:WXXGXW repeat (2 copies)